jgi:hypothetical protein
MVRSLPKLAEKHKGGGEGGEVTKVISWFWLGVVPCNLIV